MPGFVKRVVNKERSKATLRSKREAKAIAEAFYDDTHILAEKEMALHAGEIKKFHF
jgi:uncharacterized protein (UPF0216 family)